MKWRDLSTMQLALAGSAAFHGLLISVHFVAPQVLSRNFRDAQMDVILVNAKTQDRPDEAQAIAQSNLAGGGEAEQGRATSPLPTAQTVQLGESTEESRRRIDQMQDEQQQLLAQIRREIAALPPPDPRRENGTTQERDQEELRRQKLRLLAEIEKRINEENKRPKKRYISPATREEVYALYYDTMKHKVEERGTRDFPTFGGQKLYGELTMNITVDSTGRVLETDIVRSSKSAVLDRQAIAIVQAASPFGLFTSAMRKQADQIVVTSRFRFTREEGLETQQMAPQDR